MDTSKARKVSDGRAIEPSPSDSPPRIGKGWLYLLLGIGGLGPILFFCAAVVFGVTEVHSSTDTYIGLAGGRAIAEAWSRGEPFPKLDTFSINFSGQPWYNQNWGTHLWQWWLYDGIHPDAVIWGTWTMSTLTFMFCGLAVWLRTRSLLAAILAAAIIGIGFRDWISARPSTTQFFLVSIFWMLICALESQGDRRRWWPIVLLYPLLMIWGAAHGSSAFAYSMLALYAAYWAITWGWGRIFPRRTPTWADLAAFAVALLGSVAVIWKVGVHQRVKDKAANTPGNIDLTVFFPYAVLWTAIGALVLTVILFMLFRRERLLGPALRPAQIIGLLTATLLAFVMTVAIGPFGLENFTHQGSVASTGEDAVAWREVQEWRPPYDSRGRDGGDWYPPVGRFFAILWASLLGLIIAGGCWLFGSSNKKLQTDSPPAGLLRITAFDVLAVAIGLIMTFFARRFAPYFLIFAAPAFVVVLIAALRPLLGRYRLGVTFAAMAAGWIGFIATLKPALDVGANTVPDLERGETWLTKVTNLRRSAPVECIQYLHDNDLQDVRLLTEWTWAGVVMFYAPQVKVYMDGRAQQVYTVEHYRSYQRASVGMVNPQTLADSGVNAVLTQHGGLLARLEMASDQWVCVMQDSRENRGMLFLRKDSPAMTRVWELVAAGIEVRPSNRFAQFMRGNVWYSGPNPNYAAALNDWSRSYERDPQMLFLPGAITRITHAMLQVGPPDNAMRFLNNVQQGLLPRARFSDERQRTYHQQQISILQRQLRQMMNETAPSD